MSNHRRRNQLSETTGKLAASPTARRNLVAQELLSSGGRAPGTVRMSTGGRTPRRAEHDDDRTGAFVRALLGR